MRILLWILALVVLVAALGFATVTGLYAYYARDLPDPAALQNRQLFQTARIFDRNGQLLEELVDPQGGRRTLVSISQVSDTVKAATIAAEDASFYANPGFDPRAIVRAFYQWGRYGEPQSGASTITQQLVKNTLLSAEQTAERKIKEAFLAIELTRRYSKDQILEMYLNEIFYGNRAYGIEAAAQTYFGKTARDLNLAEASLLAGLPQAPSLYDPYTRLPAAKERQRYVLDQMVRVGAVTEAQARAAYEAPLDLKPQATNRQVQAPHFVNFVRQAIEAQFGTQALFREGLQITTTLDLSAQRVAERVARDHLATLRDRNVNNAALVALRPSSGEVLAMLGSVNFEDASIDGQVNVALAERQPGSTLKPFTFLAAFAKGWSPATLVLDVPSTFGGNYRPNNFDNQFRGPMTVRGALAESRNITAVKALEFVGMQGLLDTLHRMGVQSLRDPARYGLSVTLGGGEVRLIDLTYAYGALANGGRQVGYPVPAERREPGFRQFEPVAILKVTDHAGRVVYQYNPPQGVEVADPRLAYQITHILADDEARAPTFGRRGDLFLEGRPAAVKTGTTDRYVDAWVVGYTPDLVTGVWVGNTDNRPMRDVGGSLGAGRIWNAFMSEVLKGTPPRPFPVPSGVVEAEVCRLSGLLPTPECRELDGTVRDVFAQGINLPTKPDDWHKRVEVCKVSGKIATPLVPPNGREMRVFVQLPDALRAWPPMAERYPPPPTETCDDVYQGHRKAEVAAPRPGDRIEVGQQVQVVGSAFIDDFAHYTLLVGPGTNPTTWFTLTDRRAQGVDSGLLGVWDTGGAQAGPHTLKVIVSDSLGNTQEGQALVNLQAAPTPTPQPQPTPAPAQPTPAATRPATAPTQAAPTPAAPAPTRQATIAPAPTPAAPTPAPKPKT